MKSTLVHRILALLLALFGFTLPTYADTPPTVAADAGSKLFIARYNTGNFIARANVDGTALNATSFALPNNAIGVTVDTVNGKLYWSSFTAGGSIGRMNLDGSGAEPNFLTGVLAVGMAVDPTNGWLYLAGGAIKRVRLDGTGLTTLIPNLNIGGFTSCSGVALDVPNNKLYYAFNTAIGRANLDGTSHTPTYITTGGGAPPDDVAIDRVNGQLYWTVSGGNKIGRANVDGTGIQSAFLSVTGPRSLIVDPQASKVFWSDGSGVGRANLDGTGANASFLSGVSGSWGIAIGDVDTEGTQATHTGTYSDADGDTVTFSANIGSVTKTGTSSGTWTWTYTPPDGPTTLNVTITANDGTANSTTSFTVNVNNIAPTIALTGNSTLNVGAAYTLGLGAITDPGTDTVTGYSINWGDGSTENFSAPLSASKTHTYTTNGSKTIAVSLTDEDGTFVSGIKTITVNAAPTVATDVGSKLFIARYGNQNRIARSNVDGSGLNANYFVVTGNPIGVAVDTVGGKIFWTQFSAGKIGRANLDGSGANSDFITGLNGPIGLAVDSVNSRIYWAEYGSGSIKRSNLDGTGVTTLVSANNAYDVALDVPNNRLYYCRNSSSNIGRADLDGTNDNSSFIVTAVSGLGIYGLGVDSMNGKIYWAGFGTQKIGRANVNGTGLENAFLSLNYGPDDVVVDPQAGKVYWTTQTGGVGRANLDGSGMNESFLTGLGLTWGIALGDQDNEGSLATRTGTYSDADGNTVTFSANIGSVTKTGTSSGTWTWTYTPPDGPATHSVTITANDGTTTSTTSFTVSANNIAPAIVLTGNSTVNAGASYTLNLGAITDPGTDTVTSYSINWGDGVIEPFSGSPASTSKTHTYTSGGSKTITVSLTDEDGTHNGGTLAVTVIAPEIDVQQPAGTSLTDGSSTVNYGSVAAGATSDKVFTIRNTGTANLTGLGITIDGTSASEFSVTVSPTAPVSPSGNTTFTVRFAPSPLNGAGPRNAALHIASNDGDENPFGLALTGALADTTPPDTTITSGPSSPTSSTSATIAFTGSDDISPTPGLTYEGRLDGAAFATVTSPVSLSGLADGSHTWQVRAKDAAGNVDPSPASVTWVVDTTPPSFTLPGPITAEAAGPGGAGVTYSASADDSGSEVASSSFTPASGSTFAIGTTTVNASATDNAGNTASGSFTVRVVDTTAPVISGVPANITTDATAASGAVVAFAAPTATDLVDGAVTVNCSPASGSTFAIGTTTVTCTATDAHGNTVSQSFSVTVKSLTQTITFTNPGAHTYGDAAFVLNATGGGSGNAVDFAIVSGPASVSGSTLTILGAGDVTVRASQAAGNGYTAAAPVDQAFTVAKASQAIDFTLSATAVTTDTFTLTARGGASGNPVTFSIVSGPGSIDGSNVLAFTTAGDMIVRASQAGDANYDAAPDVDRTIVVSDAGGVTAVDDRAAATSGSVLIDVLANDSDATNRPLSIVALTQPAMGKVTIEGTKIRFTPKTKTSVTTPLTFTYTVKAGDDTATATVTIVPPPPGNFIGLLSRDGVVLGRVNVTVTATGIATGALRREGRGFSFKGSILGQAGVAFARSTVPAPTMMKIPLGALDDFGQPTLHVTISDMTPGLFLTGVAERSPYDATHPAPQAGRYTMIAERPNGGTGPQTGATMVCTIAANGVASLAGRLGDNTAATHSGRLLSGGRFPFYAATGVGTVRRQTAGTLVFDRTASPAVTGTLHWAVPTGVLATLPAGVDQDYDTYGLIYTPAAVGSAMFTPSAANASLTLGYATPLVRNVAMNGIVRAGSQRFTFTGGSGYLLPASGFFLGTHTPSKNVNRGFFGVILQSGGINQGYGNLMDSNAIRPITLAPQP